MKTGRMIVIALLATLAWGEGIAAQPPGERARPQREQMERQLRERFMAMLQESLQLSEDQVASITEVMDDFGPQRRELSIREARLQRELRSAGEALSDQRASEILEAIIQIREDEIALETQELQAFREVLEDRQVLRLIRVREDWGRRIQDLRRRGTRGGPGGGPGGGSGGGPSGNR